MELIYKSSFELINMKKEEQRPEQCQDLQFTMRLDWEEKDWERGKKGRCFTVAEVRDGTPQYAYDGIVRRRRFKKETNEVHFSYGRMWGASEASR